MPATSLTEPAHRSRQRGAACSTTGSKSSSRGRRLFPPEAPIGEVLKRMIDERMGCVAVVDDQQRLLGIFTERDALLRLNVDVDKLRDKPVGSMMTSPTTLRTRDKIAYALHRMNVGGFRHIPIVDGREHWSG